MKLWGGRFTKKTDDLAYSFNESLSFDNRLYEKDIQGSMAHVAMLKKQGILSDADAEAITKGLEEIKNDIESGKLQFSNEYEDIHSFIEGNLTERIGEAGKRLHTGRSRNDQVALDMRLYTRDMADSLNCELTDLLKEIYTIMEANVDTVMPGFTHMQKAQPVTLAHHMGAYFEMFYRDRCRVRDARMRMNECPLGAGALAGTTYPLDREYTAKLLNFDRATINSMDSVSDRDYLIELLSDMSIIAMHLSRLSEEIIIWNSDEYKFVDIDDTYSTGSSIMPQKKNPDIAELLRGKTGRVYGALISLLTVMKGLPLAYDKDMQEDKELSFDAMDTALGSIKLMTGMLKAMRFNKKRMEDSCKSGYANATDVADYLVKKGVAFRDAHGYVGALVLMAINEGKSLDELSLDEYKSVCDIFDNDIYEAISLKTCIEGRNTKGAPGTKAMKEELSECKRRLEK